MGIFDRLFKKDKIELVTTNLECLELLALRDLITNLLNEDNYISKRYYKEQLEDFSNIVEHFLILQKSDLLDVFCKNNNTKVDTVINTIDDYNNIDSLINQHNNNYINTSLIIEKAYLDDILTTIDKNIKLDDDQRKVVLTDEDYCLVIAGAGAGKTTTVAAKVKYLVEKKHIDEKQILVISFTNKAVQELKDKINNDLKIDCPIATFHSTGNAIIRKQSNEKLNIVDSSKLYYVLQDYFKNSILKNESLVNNIILFFASYIDAPFDESNINDFFNKLAKSNFTTMRSDLEDFKQQVIDNRSKKSITIQNEILRSQQEVEIANYLYLNNLDYQYEPIYKFDINFSRKPYTPDFIIKQGDKYVYLEHFGITQDGHNDRYSKDELETYKKAINNKITLHQEHGTPLIYTFSKYNDKHSLTDHLQEELIKKGFELNPRPNSEVMNKIISSEENRYIRKLVNLICRFIGNFKTNGYNEDDFTRMKITTTNVRSKLFLDICLDCYLEYQRYLKENEAVDFEDMINESARLLREVKEMNEKLDFKYIIVDEYQDISMQRFDLVKALSEVTDAKIIAVGDDWQSIYAFSGADVSLFTNFEEKMGYARLLKIVNTYRNSQEVIDIAGNFIQKNKTQIVKQLKSPKSINDPVIIYTYDGSPKKASASFKDGPNYRIAHALEVALEQIITFNKQENKPANSSILILGRYGFDGDKLEKSGRFENVVRGGRLKSVKYPNLNLTFMTAHSSKGLGYDNVIIINARNETFGFPSKIEDDPVLNFVIKNDRSIDYAEERRLFYVAMTRTKNRVFFIAPEQNPSEFLIELKKDYKNIVLNGKWQEKEIIAKASYKKCPVCGYPLQFRYKNAYGLKLYLCTNDPEVCGFMTNDFGAGNLSISKCDKCRDGYLVVKLNKDGNYMLGCTNYSKDGKGCGNYIIPNKVHTPIIEPVIEKPKQDNQPKVKNKQQLQQVSNPKTITSSYNLSIEKDVATVIAIILKSLVEISEVKYYGVTTLLDFLRQSSNKKMVSANLNMLPSFGSLKSVSREDLEIIIYFLIDNDFILKTVFIKLKVGQLIA